MLNFGYVVGWRIIRRNIITCMPVPVIEDDCVLLTRNVGIIGSASV